MNMLLGLLLLGSLIAMVVGLIKPGLVIRWGEQKTRPRVLMVYGGLFILLFVVLGMTGTAHSDENGVKLVTNIEHPNIDKEKINNVNDVSKQPLSSNDSKKLLQSWIDAHKFNSTVSITEEDGNMHKRPGSESEYYVFQLQGLHRIYDILVDPKTRELFMYDSGKPELLDPWYQNYIAPYNNPNKDNKNTSNYIDKKFEWVEKPSVRDGYIVGKIKNISNREQFPTVTFALFDYQGNQIGNATASLMSFSTGNIWKFKTSINNARVTDYKFSGID